MTQPLRFPIEHGLELSPLAFAPLSGTGRSQLFSDSDLDIRSSIAVVLLLLFASPGCQNGGQQDLVLRELRMQEDQLYAMENYLSEYQQLVCKYRSENAALRRELADRRDDGDLPLPDNRRAGEPGGRSGPALQTPQSTPQQQPAQEAAPAPDAVEEPAVPPLETSTDSPPPPIDAALYAEVLPEVVTTAGHVTVKGLESIEPATDAAQAAVDERPSGVMMRGEILANEGQGGSRLVVDVAPFDMAGDAVQFHGTLSLMLLDPKVGEEPLSVARWDFGAEEVEAALESAESPTMRFYLELPAETELPELAELWVRLVPPAGEKLLTQAEVNLAQPGRFSSNNGEPAEPAPNDAVQPASFESPPIDAPQLPVIELADGWTIARPDDPVAAPGEDNSASEWRASLESIAVVAQAANRASRAVDSIQLRAAEKVGAELPPLYKRPTWTAERPAATNPTRAKADRESATSAQRPRWSATR